MYENTFYSKNDFRLYLKHYGVPGMKWKHHKYVTDRWEDRRTKAPIDRWADRRTKVPNTDHAEPSHGQTKAPIDRWANVKTPPENRFFNESRTHKTPETQDEIRAHINYEAPNNRWADRRTKEPINRWEDSRSKNNPQGLSAKSRMKRRVNYAKSRKSR